MVVLIDSSAPGKVARFRPAWRKCMAMTRRPASTIGFIGLQATNTIGYYLDRVAGTRPRSDGAPLRELAERLRASLVEPGGVLSELSPEAQHHLHDEAKRLAAVFQRSSSNVEGRNGYLSLRSHQLRGLDRPRKRACFTVSGDQKPHVNGQGKIVG